MARASLPPGFRFHPTDVELIMYYLKRKVMGKKLLFEAIAEVNIYKFSPWDLPDKSCLKSKDLEWFFFCPREKKYASGIRVKRATENGYWKTTGKDRSIIHNDRTVGSVKTLVFHLGHAPKGERTDWVIHEYKILDDHLAAAGLQDTYALCKVFKKNGPGPKNGAQYGAPFNEADWVDDDDTQNHAVSFASDGLSPTMLMQPETPSCSPMTGLFDTGSMFGLPKIEGPPSSANHPTSEVFVDETDDEIVHLLASFTDDKTLFNETGINQDDLNGNGIYNDLGDLVTCAKMDGSRLDLSEMQEDGILMQDNLAYIELNDFLAPLNCSDDVGGTNELSLGEIFGCCSQGSSQPFSSGASSAGMNHYSSCTNQLTMLPEVFDEGDNCLDVLHMVDNRFYSGCDVAYGMNFALGQADNGIDSNQDMERGTDKKTCFSGLTESIPAPSPSAAEHLALLFSTCGGSSIHIKAEVTHGAGECTNEALSVMMGGSSSCWCNLHWLVSQKTWLSVGSYVLYFVEFGFHVLLVYYYLNGRGESCVVFFRVIVTWLIIFKCARFSSIPRNTLHDKTA